MLDSATPASAPVSVSAAGSLSRRIVDNLFNRLPWYLLPIILFAGLGVYAASRISDTYVARGGLSATYNPSVGQAQVRGNVINEWETPAAGIARLINEQLRTESFIGDVADRAGAGEALARGFVTPDTIRQRVGARATGQSYLIVEAHWEDPTTAHALVEATIEAYLDRVQELVTSDSNDAIAFWTELRNEAEAKVEEAETALNEFLASTPAPVGGERPAAEQMLMLRLSNDLDRALGNVNDAQSAIDSARLNLQQARSEAGRQLQVVDPPRVPTQPKSTTAQALLTLMMLMGTGVVISAIAVVTATLLDRTIRSERQLASAGGLAVTASVPHVKPAKRGHPVSSGSPNAAPLVADPEAADPADLDLVTGEHPLDEMAADDDEDDDEDEDETEEEEPQDEDEKATVSSSASRKSSAPARSSSVPRSRRR